MSCSHFTLSYSMVFSDYFRLALDSSLPLLSTGDLSSSEIIGSVWWQSFTVVSVQPFGPIFKSQEIQDYLNKFLTSCISAPFSNAVATGNYAKLWEFTRSCTSQFFNPLNSIAYQICHISYDANESFIYRFY
jgi:hypothetical protein